MMPASANHAAPCAKLWNLCPGIAVTAAQMAADGGNLNAESLQDTSKHDSKQLSVNLSLSAEHAITLQAAQGGFDIRVHGNTDLTGAVIASSQQAIDPHRNRLSTGTLTYRDLHNHAEYQGSSLGLSASASVGGKAGDPDQNRAQRQLLNAGQNGGVSDGKYGVAKAIAGNLLNNGHAARDDASQTRSAISAGAITLSGQDGTSLATLSRDTAQTHRAVQEQDVQQLGRDAQVNQAFKQAVFQEAVKFTDESYRKLFLEQARIYVLVRGPDGRIQRDAQGIPQQRELSATEKQQLQPAADGKIHVANNGIFTDTGGAAKYGAQHGNAAGPQYLIVFPEADNAVSELLIAGYQKFLEGDTLGLAHVTQENKRLMQQYGREGLQLDGHSRGAMTIGNALESLSHDATTPGSLSGTTINFYGPAYNAAQADGLLSRLQDRDAITDPVRREEMAVHLENHWADPVGRWIGGNPATGGTIPAGSNAVWEAFRALGGKYTVHNCYGRSDAKQCQQFWSQSINNQPVLLPIRGTPSLPSAERP